MRCQSKIIALHKKEKKRLGVVLLYEVLHLNSNPWITISIWSITQSKENTYNTKWVNQKKNT